MYELHKHNHSPAPLRNFLDNDNGAFPNRPLSRAAVTNPAGCGQIRLARRRAVTNPAGGGANNFRRRRRRNCGASLSYKPDQINDPVK